MRDIKRIRKFCDLLATYWEIYCPDIRFGQLMTNVLASDVMNGKDPFYIEDDEFIRRLETYFKEMDYL